MLYGLCSSNHTSFSSLTSTIVQEKVSTINEEVNEKSLINLIVVLSLNLTLFVAYS